MPSKESKLRMQGLVKNPMLTILTKDCTRCSLPFPNTFKFFAPKPFGNMVEKTTKDVCRSCKGKAMTEAWAKKRAHDRKIREQRSQAVIDKVMGRPTANTDPLGYEGNTGPEGETPEERKARIVKTLLSGLPVSMRGSMNED